MWKLQGKHAVMVGDTNFWRIFLSSYVRPCCDRSDNLPMFCCLLCL